MEAFSNTEKKIDRAVGHLHMGDLIAYPTESVFGIGCDPFNADAVARLLQAKQRPLGKGFILVGHSFEQLEFLTNPIDPGQLTQVLATWPGPVTWIFPASKEAPKWITGDYDTIAIRVSNHPIIQRLCREYNQPIVSTSANKAGQIPATSADTVKLTFGNQVIMTIDGKLGGLAKPTTIRDALTGEILRA